MIATEDLTLADVPESDVPPTDLIGFAATLNGYAEMDGQAMGALAERWKDDGGPALTLHELRLVLFIQYRADYHSGGMDRELTHMRHVVREIRNRLHPAPTVEVWKGDITEVPTDAIVNAANVGLLGGGGVDGAIHRAAGPELLQACRSIPEVRPGVRCPVGQVRVTPGFDLRAPFVIHTVGPKWQGGDQGEGEALASCYRSGLAAADAYGIESVAFPLISTGVYGFPTARAARIAVQTVNAWYERHDRPKRTVLVAFDEDAMTELWLAHDRP